MTSSILFSILLASGVFLFTKNVRRVIRNINLGRPLVINDRKPERWKTMLRVAFGQSKMMVRPVPGVLHFIVYAGFIIINIEVVEIIIDGVAGTHRVFAFAGGLYSALIGSFEILAFLVLTGCVVFLIRRNILRLARLNKPELNGWPRTDANLILITEIMLMGAFLKMNAVDSVLQDRNYLHYIQAGWFPVSNFIKPFFETYSNETLVLFERSFWWFHIIGILAFLNYLPYSKHFHILLAFPNTWYSKLEPKGKLTNPENVTNEVRIMLDPSAAPPASDSAQAVMRFGASDVKDLTWKQLMDAYSCTECGRCTSVCPANLTGKKLSPRKIMMDTRDRLEEVGRGIDKSGIDFNDNKTLVNDYITTEELWACTTCNACVEACPVNIDPLSIIVDLRRYLVMEQSSAPTELNSMFSKIENNQAPWQFSPADRLNWANEE